MAFDLVLPKEDQDFVDIMNLRFKEHIESQESEFRNHLGGSMIGRKCERQLWYNFRWAASSNFDGRMLRLFNRGHLEEHRFIQYLRLAGATVNEYSERLMYHPESDCYMTIPHRDNFTPPQEPEIEAQCDEVTDQLFHVYRAKGMGIKLKQWRISDIGEHFGGSLDGIAQNIPHEKLPPNVDILTEFKTHNDKSFKKLVLEKLKAAKPEHWYQMQVYMNKKEIDFGFYMAVNKDNEGIYTEVVYRETLVGIEMIKKAGRIIHARQPPNRAFRSPTWFDCKYCDYNRVCWHNEPLLRHCRSCVNAVPVDDGQWHCSRWDSIIPVDAIPKGCDHYKMITD